MPELRKADLRRLVVAILPRRLTNGLSTKELDQLATVFLKNGTAALHAQHGTLHQAAAAITTARHTIATARHRQAHISEPDGGEVLLHRREQIARKAIDQNKAKWMRVPGVVGFAVGTRWTSGHDTGEPCINIYVQQKKSERSLAKRDAKILPKEITYRGTRIGIDVIEFGRLRRFARAGLTLGVKGTSKIGTVGTFAIDNASSLAVALTAMHVSGQQNYPPGSQTAFSYGSGNVFGWLAKGTMNRIDAAKITLASPADAQLEIEGIGAVRGWRPLNGSGDSGAPVRMRGSQSGLVAGRIERPSVDLPDEGLVSAILVNIQSTGGDSGAALVDNQNLVLGLLVGESTSTPVRRVFCPIGPVLSQLGCNIPTSI